MIESFATCACAALAVFFGSLAVLNTLAQMEFDRRKEERTLPVILALVMPLTPNLARLISGPAFVKLRKDTQDLIMQSGYDQIVEADRFIAATMLVSGMGLGLMLLMVSVNQTIGGLIIFLLLSAWPILWLRGTIRKRHEQIQKALPNVLDLLTLSVEAGKDFVTSLRDILSQRRRDALTEELEIAFREIQLGKQRRFALKDMATRVKQQDLTAVVNAIAQADELGVSIGQLLRIQGEQMRMKRFQRAEKLANEAPVKILLPVVVFIFPSVFIILLGPILSQAFKSVF